MWQMVPEPRLHSACSLTTVSVSYSNLGWHYWKMAALKQNRTGCVCSCVYVCVLINAWCASPSLTPPTPRSYSRLMCTSNLNQLYTHACKQTRTHTHVRTHTHTHTPPPLNFLSMAGRWARSCYTNLLILVFCQSVGRLTRLWMMDRHWDLFFTCPLQWGKLDRSLWMRST